MYLRNRRTHTRKMLDAKGWIEGSQPDTWTEIKIVDISKGGFAFNSMELKPLDSIHNFRLQFPDSSRLMHFSGRIAHCVERPYPDGFRLGVEFKKIDVTDLAAIEWLLDSRKH